MGKRTKSIHRQMAEYLVAGGAFFWSGYASFALLYSVFGWPLFIAKQAANLIGLLVNYVLEDQWVFKRGKSRKPYDRRRTSRYVIITVVNFGIDYLIVAGLKDAGITPYVGQFVSAAFFTLWNFGWYRYWVFAQHPSRKQGKRSVKRSVS